MTFLRVQASAAEAHHRVDSLERALNVGLTELRALYGRFRPKLQTSGNAAEVAGKVNRSLNEWSPELFSCGGKLGSRHRGGPPVPHKFGAVIIPDWRFFAPFDRRFWRRGPPRPAAASVSAHGRRGTEEDHVGARRKEGRLLLCVRRWERPPPSPPRPYIHELGPRKPAGGGGGGGGGREAP